jgi:hypothetical protein
MKKNIFIIGLVLFFIITIFTGCSQSKYSKEIESIDQIMLTLDSCSETMLLLDTAFANNKWDTIKVRLKFMKDYYAAKKDSASREESFLVSDYYSLRKPFRDFTMNYKKAQKELKFSKEQLVALRQDLKNNILKEELAKKHIFIEQAASKTVIVEVNKLQSSLEINSKKIDRLQPKIDSLITQINKAGIK